MMPFWKKTGKHSKSQSAQKRRQNAKPAVPRTAQQSIPMQRMFEDGTCRVKPNYYTRTIQYQDINYQLAQQEDKTAIFEEWCSFLNFFDSSIKFELSFVNMATDSTEFEKSIRIPFQKDGFDDVRAEYSQMLRQQLAKGNNGLTKTKFITFGVEGESMAQVKPRLDHIQNDLLNNFHRLGVQAKPLNGAQRLKLMHDMFNMDGASKFHFDWKDLVKSGLSAKDAIAPTAFSFKNSRTFQMGGIFCAASFLSITASDISDQLLKDFLDMDSSQIVTMHIQSVDQNRAIKTVKRTITELDRSKIEEQKKAIRAGYDIDIIPSDLATYGRDAKALLKELQSQNERMFLVTFLVLNTGRTEQELENNVFQASSIAQKHNCNLCRLDFQQEHGLMSSLPLADCQIEIQRGLTTSSTAIFIPFTTQELYQSGKESLYYGLNALSNNLIMVDRKKLKNPNGLILGTPGSGKSFSAKREITNAFLVTDDDIIINDPEGEYSPLVNRLKGQVIKISPNSTQFVNPMDINANYSEEDNPLSLKADFILSLCELVVGGKEGLLPVEKTVIDRCVHLIYRKYFANPCPENMPILEDLYNALLQQDEKEAHHVATALEIYVKGSLNLFNHRTNVNVNNRIPDGGVVQVDYPDGRSFTARLEHLDDYHFDMGGLGNVFHICQFAEVMERNHADFYPEIQTQDEQAAWELGGKGYLAIQSCEDGWDYTLYHSDYSVMDGGQLGAPELTIQEAREQILEAHHMEKGRRLLQDYDAVMDKVAEAEELSADHRPSTLEKLAELASDTSAPKSSERSAPEL